MALYPDEEDPTKPKTAGAGAAGAQPAAPQTFAQLQAKGMPRPPAPMQNPYGGGAGFGVHPSAAYGGPAPGAPPPGPGPAPLGPGGQPLYGGGAAGGRPPFPGSLGGNGPGIPTMGPSGGAHGAVTGAQGGGGGAGQYNPTGQLNQGNLEGYLYDMLANPTATPTYQNAMKTIGSNIDTDASKRGVFYSTIPVGSYSNAGSNLAAGLQGQAYNQLRGYNQDYEQLLMSLLGAT